MKVRGPSTAETPFSLRTRPLLPTPSLRRHRAACAASPAAAAASLADFQIQEVFTGETSALRAAAYLRAASFFEYPPDREFAARSHRRLKADEEWESLEGRLQGTDKVWKGIQVFPLVATIPYDPEDPLSQALDMELDKSAKLPADGSHARPSCVVGTLDVNVGIAIPSEDLVGAKPSGDDSDPASHRAYLSNVCVAKSVRRRGVAAALMGAGEELARRKGVRHLYVHVVVTNVAAKELYLKLGFSIESEESEAGARALMRPRRYLLGKKLA